MKFPKEINDLRQTIGQLNEQIILLGKTPKTNVTANGGKSTQEKIIGDYRIINGKTRLYNPNTQMHFGIKSLLTNLRGFLQKLFLPKKIQKVGAEIEMIVTSEQKVACAL